MRTYIFGRRIHFIAPIFLIVVAALSLLVMILWNALMPAIFNLPAIKFWEAVGLFVLSRLLFGMGRPHGHWMHSHWKPGIREKFSKMTPEEKKEFFKKIHSMRSKWYHNYCENAETEKSNQTE